MIQGNGIINAVLLAKAGGTKAPTVKDLALDLYGIGVNSRGVTIGKSTNFLLPEGVTPEQAKTFLSNLKEALSDKTSKYDLKQVKDILRSRGISLEKITGLEGKTGNALIEALLARLTDAEGAPIKPYNYLTPAAKLEADEKNMKALENAAEAYKNNPSKETKAACTDASDKLWATYNPYSTPLEARYKKAMIDINKANEVFLARLEEPKQARKTEGEIKKADFAALLQLIDKDIVKKNDHLKELIGERLVEIIKGDAAAADPTRVKSYLASYVHLPYNQKLVSFNVDAYHSYVILAEREGDKWEIKSKGLPVGTFYVEEKGGSFTVRRNNPGWIDHKFETAVIETNKSPLATLATTSAGATATVKATAAASVRYPEGLNEAGRHTVDLIVKINPNIVQSQELMNLCVKAVSDGKINEEEAKQLGIYGRDGNLFQAIDNHMRTGVSGGNRVLDLAELEEAASVISDYAQRTGISQADAANLYSTMHLVDMDFDGISSRINNLTKTVGSGILTGLSDNDLDARLKDLKALMAPDLYSVLVSQIKHGVITNAKQIGIFAFGSAMASMTGLYQTFHVVELEPLVKEGKISKFSFKRAETSADDFEYWVKEGKVKDAEAAGGSGGGDSSKVMKSLNELQYSTNEPEKYYLDHKELEGNSSALEVITRRVGTLIDKGDLDKAEEILKNPAFKDIPQRHELVSKLIQKALDKKDNAKAKSYLELIDDKTESGRALAAYANHQLKIPPKVSEIRDTVLVTKSNDKGEEAVEVKQGTGAAQVDAASAKFDEIINDQNNKYTAEDKAYAMHVKGQVNMRYGLSLSGANGTKQMEYLYKAQSALVEAYKSFKALNTSNNAELNTLIGQVITRDITNVVLSMNGAKYTLDDKNDQVKIDGKSVKPSEALKQTLAKMPDDLSIQAREGSVPVTGKKLKKNPGKYLPKDTAVGSGGRGKSNKPEPPGGHKSHKK